MKKQTLKTMKPHPSYLQFCVTILAAGAACLLAGCASTAGYKQADKTGAGIAEFREEIVNAKQAIDETVQALDAIAVSANTDPRAAYQRFSKSVSNLESASAKAQKRGQAMKEQGQAYFAQWEKQLAEVQNPEIRALAQQRKAKLSTTFDSIKRLTEPLKAQFDPWMSDLKDLQKYLSNDLTIAGVDAARPLFTKTKTSGLAVQKSMDELVAELNAVSAAVTPAKVPAGKSN